MLENEIITLEKLTAMAITRAAWHRNFVNHHRHIADHLTKALIFAYDIDTVKRDWLMQTANAFVQCFSSLTKTTLTDDDFVKATKTLEVNIEGTKRVLNNLINNWFKSAQNKDISIYVSTIQELTDDINSIIKEQMRQGKKAVISFDYTTDDIFDGLTKALLAKYSVKEIFTIKKQERVKFKKLFDNIKIGQITL